MIHILLYKKFCCREIPHTFSWCISDDIDWFDYIKCHLGTEKDKNKNFAVGIVDQYVWIHHWFQ